MQFKNFANTILLVISMSSMATAQLLPGDPSRPPRYPGPGGGLGPAPYPYPGGPGMGPGPGHPHEPPPGWSPPMQPRPPRPPQPPYYPPQQPPYYPPQPPPNYPPPNPGYGTEVKHIFLNRNVVNENIDLRAYAGIGYNYSGAEVVSVRANVRSNGYRTMAQLLADGRVVATQMDANFQAILYPQVPLVLDQTVHALFLNLNGNIFVDSIDVEVRSSGNQPGGNIDIPVYRSVFGNDRIDLSSLVDLNRYRGYRIQQVIVTATARYGSAAANLMINGLSSGNLQFTGGYSQRQTLWLGNQPMIGSGADSLVLYTSGDMTVENVTLIVR